MACLQRIYNAYPAAGQLSMRKDPDNPLNSSSQKRAYLSYAEGGSLAELSFIDRKAKARQAPAHGGGSRGRVRGFSRSSRTRFLRHLARINRGVLRASQERPVFLTLTFPAHHAYPKDPAAVKDSLHAFRRRLGRRYGNLPGYWRLGVHQTGRFHLHLTCFCLEALMSQLRSFAAS
jgi:hypothetical protein